MAGADRIQGLEVDVMWMWMWMVAAAGGVLVSSTPDCCSSKCCQCAGQEGEGDRERVVGQVANKS